jgi:hypothetical protein
MYDLWIIGVLGDIAFFLLLCMSLNYVSILHCNSIDVKYIDFILVLFSLCHWVMISRYTRSQFQIFVQSK